MVEKYPQVAKSGRVFTGGKGEGILMWPWVEVSLDGQVWKRPEGTHKEPRHILQ